MRLSEEARREAHEINTEREALRFLRTYGSHFTFGIVTVGGVFFRNISMTTQKEVSYVALFQAAGDQLSTEKANAQFL